MSTKEIKCIYCKGIHNHIVENDSYICEYCGGLNYITTSDIDFKLQLASNNLSIYKFDEADDIYKNILEDSNNDKVSSMALMGRILSYFGIVYVKSYGSNVTTPTFSKYNPDIPSIKSSRYFKQLCNLDIPSSELNKYKEQIDELDKVYTRIDNDLNETPEYDVFICTKISAKTKAHPEQMGYTEDSRVATDLYYNFREKGLKVFYSDKVLKGVDYDSQIYSALSKSKTILVIASSKEYLESVWVESEWRRWLNFIDVGARKKDTFLLYLTDKKIEVPSILQKAQAIDYYNIYDTIDSIVNKDKKKEDKNKAFLDELKKLQEENERRQKEQEEETKRRLEQIEKENEKRRRELEEENKRRQKELEEEIKKKSSTNINTPTGHIHSYVSKVIDPTCTDEGYTEYKCLECGFIVKDNIKPSLGHSFSANVIKPTCFSGGYTEYKCIRCDEIKKGDYTNQVDHEIKDGSCTMCKKSFYSRGLHFELLPNGTYCVSKISDHKNVENVIIPDIYNGKKVTKIGEKAFIFCEKLLSVTLPTTIELIDNQAFDYCKKLTSIELPNSLTSIGEKAFHDCESLTSIEIPSSVISIGHDAFGSCKSLISITLPFIGPTSTIKANINFGYAFGSISYLGNDFYVPSSLKKVKITGGGIGEKAFYNCKNLTSIELPNNITSIGHQAFEGCINLISIEIPSSVTSIGTDAFYNCTSLTSIELPSSVTSIGERAFKGCSNLKSMTIPFIGNNLNGINTSFFRYLFGSSSQILEKLKITGNSIGYAAFKGCIGLTSIELLDGVTSIGESAFQDCTNLTSIYIPDSVTSIGASAFKSCVNLTNVKMSNSIRTIEESLFQDCKKLTNIEIPSSVTSIGDSAFAQCTELINIEIPSSVTSIGDFAFAQCTELTNIEIPSSVTSIGDSAFAQCTELISIEIPNSVTSIGEKAFQNCFSLTNIEIPNSVVEIGYGVFSKCTSLTNIEIPNSVTSIDSFAFNGCTSLKEFTIPSSVNAIDLITFDDMSMLENIYVDEKNPNYSSIDGVLFNKDKTKILLFPQRKKVKTYTIPDSVITIGYEAFRKCLNLDSVIIPKNVVYIVDGSFIDSPITILCEVKKPLFGYPNGYSKNCFSGVREVKWGYKK